MNSRLYLTHDNVVSQIKCAQYWPSPQRETEIFKEFVVNLKSEDHFPDYIIRRLSVINVSLCRYCFYYLCVWLNPFLFEAKKEGFLKLKNVTVISSPHNRLRFLIKDWPMDLWFFFCRMIKTPLSFLLFGWIIYNRRTRSTDCSITVS